MLGTTDAFKTSPKCTPCTLGIWMATSVLECDEFVVLLLDTEGTDAAGGKHSDKFGDVQKSIIFCNLVSSFFIYNSIGAIKESELEKMR